MQVTTFLVHNNGNYRMIKRFFDLSIINTGDIAYIDSETKKSIPAEVHTLYILSKNGKFRDVAYGYSKKHNLKLMEGYPDCKKWRVDFENHSFEEKIKPNYNQFKTKVFLQNFTVSKEYENYDVFGLDFFVRKKPKKYWKFQKQTDKYILGRVDKIRVINN